MHPRKIHQSFPITATVCRLTDGCSIALGLFLALQWRPEMSGEQAMLLSTSAIIAMFILGECFGMYRNWRGASGEREVLCALFTWGATLLTLIVLGFAIRAFDQFSRGVLLAWFVCTPALMLGFRITIRTLQRTLRSHGMNRKTYAIVGVNELGIQLAHNIENSPETGLQLIGFFDDRPDERLMSIPESFGKKIGGLKRLVNLAKSGELDAVYIAFPMRAERRIKDLLAQLSDATASVYVVPDFFVFELLHSRWSDIGGLPAVSIFENPFYGIDGWVKRSTDLVLASAALVVCAVPMLAIALAIRWSSPGPVFFRQRRYGLDGKEILVWKFRSMRVMENGTTVTQASKDDPRVTPFGKFLRRTSLDELPQLFNVIDGTMSLVGPRPHATAHNEHYRGQIGGYMLRHKVKPGITGLAQVKGFRGETDTLEKMEGRVAYDHQYIREWSLLLDLKILVKTIGVVFWGKNAY
jgi:putative colanic acid biosynthesis UDP-glucose lipid carrier transferase